MKKYFFLFWPVLFLIGLWSFFASPYLLHGKVPFPATYQVNHFPPWASYPKYWGPVKNGAMPDIIDQIYPWRHFTIQQLKDGSIPTWNPNSFAGNPHLANVQSGVFSPFNVLFFLLSFIDAWSIMIVAQPLLAGLSMYFLLRSFKRSKMASLIGSSSFMFCGFIVVWMAYGTLSMAIATLPLGVFSIVKLVQGKWKYGFLLSASLIFSFFAGHFQTSLYFLLFLFFYACYYVFLTKKKEVLLLLFCFFLLGILLSLPQIIPAIQLYNLSPRSNIFLFSGGIPIQYFITFMAPDFFGNPITRNDWFGYYAEWASFIGIIPLVLSLFSLFDKKEKDRLFFSVAALVIFLFALESPFLQFIGSLHIPVISTSTPSRIIVLLSFCLTVLASFGFDALQKLIEKKLFKKIVIVLSLTAICIIFVWLFVLVLHVLPVEKALIARKNFILPTGLFLVFVISVTLFSIMHKRKNTLLFFSFMILFLVSFDSLRYVLKWMPFEDRNLVFADVPVITRMQQLVGNGRVFGNIGGQVGTYYNIPLIEGYDPLYINKYGEFIRASETGKYQEAERSVVKLSRNGKYIDRVLDLLGVTLVFHPVADTNQTWAYPVWKGKKYQIVYVDSLFSLYKNTTVIHRPSLYYQYEVMQDPKLLLQRFYMDSFDFRSKLLLEEKPTIPSLASVSKNGTVTVKKNLPRELDVIVDSPEKGFLFLSDNYYPGWNATVNNSHVKIYRADYAFKAVEVPRGISEVRFFF